MQPNIFKDKIKVPKVRLATYLGFSMGVELNNREELSNIFANSVVK